VNDDDDDDRGWARRWNGIKRNANWVEGKAKRRRIGPPTRCKENNSQMDLEVQEGRARNGFISFKIGTSGDLMLRQY
jgi:hypothetical protein